MIQLLDEMRFLENKYNKCREMVAGELKQYPNGNIFKTKHNGLDTFYVLTKDSEGRRQKRVIKDSNVIEKLVRKLYLEHELKFLDADIAVMASAVKNLSASDSSNLVRTFLDRHPWVDDELLRVAQTPQNAELDEWAGAQYEISQYKPELRNKHTSRGLMVRTKGEVIWAEKLWEHNCPFRYEEVVWIGNVPYAPDFTVKRADGKLFYIEHMGLITNPNYYSHQEIKLRAYRSVGIIPENNLIITFEDMNGNIDVEYIDWLIEHRLTA